MSPDEADWGATLTSWELALERVLREGVWAESLLATAPASSLPPLLAARAQRLLTGLGDAAEALAEERDAVGRHLAAVVGIRAPATTERPVYLDAIG